MSEAIHPSTRRRVGMVIIGVDCHTRVHVAAAIDGQGQVGARFTASAKAEELAALTTWACQQGADLGPADGGGGVGVPVALVAPAAATTWAWQQGAALAAVAGARGFGRAVTRCLIAAGLERPQRRPGQLLAG